VFQKEFKMKLFMRFGAAILLAAGLLPADVTYTQVTKFEGGTLVDMMQKMASMPMIGRMGNMRQAFQDQQYDVYIKGNKMARLGKETSTIYDLDAGTITTIESTRRTYRTTTFDEMQQRTEQAEQRMKHGQGGDVDFDVKVTNTGQTRQIDGALAKEMLIVMTAKQANEQGKMLVTSHVWLVPYTDSTKEVADFQHKLMGKYANAFSNSGPGMGAAGKGMSEAMKEAMKQDGYPVLTEVEISGVTAGGSMPGMGSDSNSDPNAPLLKTLTEYGHFTQGSVDDSKFAVPAGFKEAAEHGRFGR
jgi:hypothetical protein